MDNNIDVISSINYNTSSLIEQTKKDVEQKQSAGDIAEATIMADNASVINSALSTNDVDMDAVNAAKQLLADGLLDSDENIASAAAWIAELGI